MGCSNVVSQEEGWQHEVVCGLSAVEQGDD